MTAIVYRQRNGNVIIEFQPPINQNDNLEEVAEELEKFIEELNKKTKEKDKKK